MNAVMRRLHENKLDGKCIAKTVVLYCMSAVQLCKILCVWQPASKTPRWPSKGNRGMKYSWQELTSYLPPEKFCYG